LLERDAEFAVVFADTVLVLVRLSPGGFVRREEESVEKMEITISDSSGKKKARIRMNLVDDAQGRCIA
jgi:hypothetical protein